MNKLILYSFFILTAYSKQKDELTCNVIPEHFWSDNVKIYNKSKLLGIESRRYFSPVLDDIAAEEVYRVKKELEPDMDLTDWEGTYYEEDWCGELIKNPAKTNADVEYYDKLTEELFFENYQKLKKPVLIKGVNLSAAMSFKVQLSI